ncbi:MAG: hypothetical protein AB7Q17_15330 [Phycisphaerae bacterium]
MTLAPQLVSVCGRAGGVLCRRAQTDAERAFAVDFGARISVAWGGRTAAFAEAVGVRHRAAADVLGGRAVVDLVVLLRAADIVGADEVEGSHWVERWLALAGLDGDALVYARRVCGAVAVRGGAADGRFPAQLARREVEALAGLCEHAARIGPMLREAWLAELDPLVVRGSGRSAEVWRGAVLPGGARVEDALRRDRPASGRRRAALDIGAFNLLLSLVVREPQLAPAAAARAVRREASARGWRAPGERALRNLADVFVVDFPELIRPRTGGDITAAVDPVRDASGAGGDAAPAAQAEGAA